MGGVASILVVDDNPKFLADALPMYGYDVTVAEDGLKALKILFESDAHFDLVLLDVMMPNMDGWDTLKAIRKNKKTEFLPVIMITAVSEDQKVVSGLKIGADDYIVKPFILPNLLARVEAVLRRSKWQAESQNKSQKTLNKDVNIDLLTPKEKEVLALVAKGASNQEIADKLFVRDVTVKTHLNSIFKKLNVTNRTQAVLLAMEIDLIN
ncbi:MAG: response regulator transcription factor [Candidatus Gastranaerophilales bacterium]|nr:response regulator transcription factor [Candidatus Gastranaerophilales bacterium]